MTKEKFLFELEKKIRHLPEYERKEIMQFYREYFEEAGPEKEQEVIKELKSPAYLASKILAEFATKEMKEGKNARNKHKFKMNNTIWFMILALFAAPIGLPILLSIAILIFTVLLLLGTALFAFFLISFALLLVGLATIFWLWLPIEGFLLIGFALISGGFAILIGTFIKSLISFVLKKLMEK